MIDAIPDLYRNLEHRRALLDWFPYDAFVHPHMVTLTIEQGMRLRHGTWVRCDRDQVVRNLNYFNDILGRRILRVHRRYRPRLYCAYWLEGTDTKRLHVHGILDCPNKDLLSAFPHLVSDAWSRTWWGYDQVDVQPAWDRGAVSYCAKLRDKKDYVASFLWEAWHLPTSPALE